MGFENYFLTFIVFMVLGWFIEITYRSFKSKKFFNPGFLRGPYLPIYGVGGLLADFSFSYTSELSLLGALTVFIVGVGLLEYFTGVFFKRVFRIRLWDYTDRRFNLGGHICLKFMFYWFLLGLFFKYFLHPLFEQLVLGVSMSRLQVFSLGLFYGVFVVDVVQTFDVAYKTRQAVFEFGEAHVAPKIITFKQIYKETNEQLNKKIREDPKVSAVKGALLSFTHYFRLSRDFHEDIRDVIREKVKEVSENGLNGSRKS